MAKKHHKTNGLGDVIPEVNGYTAKPKPYIQSQVITDYILARDRVFYKMFDYLREELLERYKK